MNNKVIKSNDAAGNEVITILDDDGNDGMSITMESVFEARELEELDATNILGEEQIEAVITPLVIKPRLVSYNGFLTHKETGKIYTVKMGNIPPIEERLAKNITGAFLNLSEKDSDEVLSVIVPFKADGSIPEAFPYNINENEETT